MRRRRPCLALLALVPGGHCTCNYIGEMHSADAARKVHTRLPRQSLDVPIGFLHPAKTGGTAVEIGDGFDCPDVRCSGHSGTALWWRMFGMQSLVILREPVSRFVSAFTYAKDGSEVHSIADARAFRSKMTAYFDGFRTVAQFVDALANKKHRLHEAAVVGFEQRESGIAFRRQAQWLAGASAEELHVVCYASDNAQGLEDALRRAGSNCSVASRMTVLNRTGKQTTTENGTKVWTKSEAQNLTLEHEAWIRATYSEDVALYDAYCGSGASPAAAAAVLGRIKHVSWETRLVDMHHAFAEMGDDLKAHVTDYVSKMHELHHLRARVYRRRFALSNNQTGKTILR